MYGTQIKKIGQNIKKIYHLFKQRGYPLYFSILSDLIYSVMNGVVGYGASSAWHGTLCAYYTALTLLKGYIYLSPYEKSHLSASPENLQVNQTPFHYPTERKMYLRGNIILLNMDLILGGAVFLLATSQGGKECPTYMNIWIAAITFYKVISSTVSIIKARRIKNLVWLMIKKIILADSLVSLLNLQASLILSFGQADPPAFHRIINGITGCSVWLLVSFLSLEGIVHYHKTKVE